MAGPRRVRAAARAGRAWSCLMAALPLLLMLGLAPWAAEARQINYFDFQSRSLPLPDPLNLGPGPFGNQWFFKETRDVAVLADGATSAKPIENWHLAVLRTFIFSGPGERTHTYLALINVETNRTFHIDLAESKGDFIHSRLATGDFTGNGMPDVAVGLNGGIDIVHLRDDAEQPIDYHRRIESDELALGMKGDFIPYTSPTTAFTTWPHRLLPLPDMDGDGVDELWTSGRFYDSLDGEYVNIGAQLLFMQDPGPKDLLPSVKHVSPFSPDVFPKSNRTLAEFGSVVARIGDRNGDGVEDVMVSAGRDCEGVDFFVLLLQPNYVNPILRSYPVSLGDNAKYWLRGCREAEGPPVVLGFGTSATVNLRVSPIRSPRSYYMSMRRLGDITGNGHPEVLVHYVARSPKGNLEKNIILTSAVSDFSRVTLLGFMTPPETLDKGFSLWASMTKPDTATAPPGGGKLLQGTADMAYAFQVYQAATGEPDRGLYMFQLPRSVAVAGPVKVAEETDVLVFKQPGYDLNQALNTLLAGLGFICSCICIAHLLHARHKASGLASLLIHLELQLFVFNAIYAAFFFAYALGTTIYTRAHGLIRDYGLNEYDADPQFFLLKTWARLNTGAVFWLQSLALLPGFWHLVLAYTFYLFLVRGRSPAVLERQARGRIWWTVILLFTALTTSQAIAFYVRGGHVGPGHVIFHMITNTICFIVITALYMRTLGVYFRRYGIKRTGRQWRPEEEPQPHQQQQHHHHHHGHQKQRQHAALWRLVLLLATFEVVWLMVIINDFRTLRRGGGLETGMGDAPSTFMVLADAIILGNVLNVCWRNRGWWRSLRLFGRGRQQLAREPTARHSLASVSMNTCERLSRTKQRSGAGADLPVRIYASTYNLGSAGRDVAALGSLEAWIPLGFDLYVIGLQECPSALLDELKRAVHARLGGAAEYALFQNHVWSTNGEIALLVLARARDVAAGAFEILGGLFNRVNLGVSVGVWRLPNKAAVGLACRLHDRTLACVTAHFAADKHGKERPEARVQDAVRSLKELSLGHESEEVDLQLAFHHVLLIGDLNFRVRLPPERVVQRVAAAVSGERRALRRLFPGGQPASLHCTPIHDGGSGLSAGPLPCLGGGSGSGSGASDVVTSWRLSRHRDSIQTLPPAGPFGSGSKMLSTSRSGASIDGAAPPVALDAAASGEEAKAEVDKAMETGAVRVAAGGGFGGGGRGGSAAGAGADAGAASPDVRFQPARRPLALPPLADDDEISISSGVSSNISDSSIETAEGWSSSVPSHPFSASDASEAWRGELLQGWDWVRESEELSKVMREGKALHGFIEAPLLFPPSFRWYKGARADYAKDGVAAFDGCYTLRKKSEGEKGLRPPSYTDRVLVHSLPDLADDLAIEEYDVCEAMVGSDHRPVAAAIRLTTSAEAAVAAAEQAAVVAPQPEHEVKITLKRPKYLPRKAALACKLRELGRQFTHSMAGGSVSSLFHTPDYLGELCGAFFLHYPLAMEQPTALHAERRAMEMEEGLLGRHLSRSGHGGSTKSLAEAASARGEGGGGQGQSRVHELPLRNRSSSLSRRSWGRPATPVRPGWSKRDVTSTGDDVRQFSIRASVVGLPLYVLVRLQGKGPGEELGQGILCLRDVLEEQARKDQERKERAAGSCLDESYDSDYEDEEDEDAEGGKATVLTHVDICLGGKLVGSLSVRVRVSIRKLLQSSPAGAAAEVLAAAGGEG